MRTENVDAFAAAFAAYASDVLAGVDLRPVQRIDAVVALTDVSLETAADLARLEPVGMGNAGVTALIPAAELTDVRRIGSEGRHVDMRVRTAAGSCRAVAWSMGEQYDLLASGVRMDVAARIERSVWQGAERVELVARTIQPLPDEHGAVPGLCHTPCDATCPTIVEAPSPAAAPLADGVRVDDMRDEREGGAIAELTRLAAAGDGVLIVVADVARRRAMLLAALHPVRFGLTGALLFSRRCTEAALDARQAQLADGAWIVLVDHDTLSRRPALARGFADAVVLDPPVAEWLAPAGPAWVRVDGPAEHRFAASVAAAAE